MISGKTRLRLQEALDFSITWQGCRLRHLRLKEGGLRSKISLPNMLGSSSLETVTIEGEYNRHPMLAQCSLTELAEALQHARSAHRIPWMKVICKDDFHPHDRSQLEAAGFELKEKSSMLFGKYAQRHIWATIRGLQPPATASSTDHLVRKPMDKALKHVPSFDISWDSDIQRYLDAL